MASPQSLKEKIPADGRRPSDKENERHNERTCEAAPQRRCRGTKAKARTAGQLLGRRQRCGLCTGHSVFECFEDRKASPVCTVERVHEMHVSPVGLTDLS